MWQLGSALQTARKWLHHHRERQNQSVLWHYVGQTYSHHPDIPPWWVLDSSGTYGPRLCLLVRAALYLCQQIYCKRNIRSRAVYKVHQCSNGAQVWNFRSQYSLIIALGSEWVLIHFQGSDYHGGLKRVALAHIKLFQVPS